MGDNPGNAEEGGMVNICENCEYGNHDGCYGECDCPCEGGEEDG